MLLLNHGIAHCAPLDFSDANLLNCEATSEVEPFLRRREGYKETPLFSLSCLAQEIGVGAMICEPSKFDEAFARSLPQRQLA
ncbi:hypothetical protein BSZ21_04275 [Bradyrhizobium canariense]|nr:hypothetical protein BSZ21_04275 [Bradyrhizobium canariense]